jgi:hypothetical protein
MICPGSRAGLYIVLESNAGNEAEVVRRANDKPRRFWKGWSMQVYRITMRVMEHSKIVTCEGTIYAVTYASALRGPILL